MLRDYQITAVNEVERILENDNRVMLNMPTGSGKTYTFCEIAKRYFLTEIKKVLIIVNRKELLEQTYDSLGERCFKIVAGTDSIPNTYDYYVGMVETIKNRIDKMPDLGFIIIDEAHIGNFMSLDFFDNEEVKILGVSATPTSSNSTSLSELYKNLVNPITIRQLIDNGYLVRANCWSFASEDIAANSKNWGYNSSTGDYQTGKMASFYSSPKMVDKVVDAYWEHSPGKQTMIFNVNIEHNIEVYKRLKKEGLNVYSVDSTINKYERDEIIETFKKDKHGIMCNVGVLTTGFDCPSIETIILNRSTKSLTLYLQMIGRGARISPGKKYFKILDLGNNVNTHGFYEDWRDWDKLFKECKSKGDGEAPTKTCPECGCTCHAAVKECPACGYYFQKEDDKNERKDALIELCASDPFTMDLDKLFLIGKQKNWKPYAYAYKIADHLVNYQIRHLDILPTKELLQIGEVFFDKWIKHIEKRKTEWNRNFFHDAILKKQQEKGIIPKLKMFHNEENKFKIN